MSEPNIAKTVFNYSVGMCPGCNTPLIGRATAELDVSSTKADWDEDAKAYKSSVPFSITGFEVSHNCIPARTR